MVVCALGMSERGVRECTAMYISHVHSLGPVRVPPKDIG